MGRFAEMVARHREKTKALEGKVIRAAEVVGGAGAMGYANHRFGAGEIKIFAAKDGTGGVPLDATLFVAGNLLDFTGKAGKYGEHIANLANGAGAGFAYRTGADMGDKAAASSGQATAGQLVGSAGYPQLDAYFNRWGQSVGHAHAHQGHHR